MDVNQRLRTALHDSAARLQVPGPGPGAARLRARERARRLHAVAAAAVVAVLLGGVMTVWGSVFGTSHTVVMDGGGDAQAAAEPWTLEWQGAEGPVGQARDTFLAGDGTYYALSTAPGARYEDHPDGSVPQALYRSADGLDWDVVPLGDEPWVADAGERDGLLYALSTAPGSRGGSGRVALSEDHGDTWQRADLPSEATAPDADVALGDGRVSGHLAVGDDVLVAALRTVYPVDVESLFPSGEASEGYWRQTDEGFALYEPPARAGAPVEDPAPEPVDEPVVEAVDEPVIGVPGESGTPVRTVTWAELGLEGPDDLTVDELFVSRDGLEWEPAASPFGDGRLTELTATPEGFVAVLDTPPTADQPDGGPGGAWAVELLRSTDGIAWEPLTGDGDLTAPGGLRGFGVVDGGQRLVAVPHADAAEFTLATSDDGGRSWSGTDLAAASRGEGAARTSVVAFDTGPLGVAVVAAHFGDHAGSTEYYVFTSPDAVSWSATPLREITGDGGNPRATWVAVGRDSIALGTTSGPSDGDAPAASRTFVGTPTR